MIESLVFENLLRFLWRDVILKANKGNSNYKITVASPSRRDNLILGLGVQAHSLNAAEGQKDNLQQR